MQCICIVCVFVWARERERLCEWADGNFAQSKFENFCVDCNEIFTFATVESKLLIRSVHSFTFI